MRNQALEAALTFFAKGAEVMRLVGVKKGFIITCHRRRRMQQRTDAEAG